MAWEITAYAIAMSVLVVAVAAVIGVVRAVRTLGNAERTMARVGGEAELSLRKLRELTEEATAITRSGKETFESIAAFAEGARALGEAAQAAGEAATRVSSFWRDRLILRKEQEPGAEEEKASERTDWQSVLKQLLEIWRNR